MLLDSLYSIEENGLVALEFWNMVTGGKINLKMVTIFMTMFFSRTNISHEIGINMKK
jgi:hypothetical protein